MSYEFSRREVENMKEGGYLWIFTVVTGMAGKNKSSFSLLSQRWVLVLCQQEDIGWIKSFKLVVLDSE